MRPSRFALLFPATIVLAVLGISLLIFLSALAARADPPQWGHGLSSAPLRVAGSSGPNIVLIRIDDLGDFDVARVSTPQLDQLRDEGVQFTAFYAASVCGPFTVAFTTGLDQVRTGAVQPNAAGALSTSYRTLMGVLRSQGYASIEWVGKFGAATGGVASTGPYADDAIAAGIQRYWGAPMATPTYVGSPDDWASLEIAVASSGSAAVVSTLTDYLWDEQVAECIARIAAATEPFFIGCGLNAPHEHGHDPEGGPPYTEAAAACAAADPEDCIDEMVTWLDTAVGDIYDAAEARGGTITIAASDNGGWSQRDADRDRTGGTTNPDGAKGSFNEAGINTDLWVAGDGVAATGVVTDLVAAADLFTTIADLAGKDTHTLTTDAVGARRVEDGASFKDRLFASDTCATPSVGCHYDTARRWISAISWNPGPGPYSRVLIDKDNPTCKLRCDHASLCAYNAASTSEPESFTLPNEFTAAASGTCFDNRYRYAHILRAKTFFDDQDWCDMYAATDPQVYCEDFGAGITDPRTLLEEFGTLTGSASDTTNTPPSNGFALINTGSTAVYASSSGIGCTTGWCRADIVLWLSDTQPGSNQETFVLYDAAGSLQACGFNAVGSSDNFRVSNQGGTPVVLAAWEALDAQWLTFRIETKATTNECKVWVDAWVDGTEAGTGALGFAKMADGASAQASSWWSNGVTDADVYIARIAITDDATATPEP